jgi:hypothetical protein
MSVGNFDYLRTSNATVLNQNGVLGTVTANNAPIAFDASGNFLGLVVEPARTNLLLRSEEFSFASWAKQRSIITANAINAPDGTLTADLLVATAVNNTHFTSQARAVTSGAVYTLSCFLKAGVETTAQIAIENSPFPRVKFNLSNGTIIAQADGAIGTIQNVGNGWYRCTSTFIAPSASITNIIAIRDIEISWVGDGVNGIYVWGAQLELGSNPTSYIKTEASTVTRTVATNLKSGLGDRVGQAEGTIYAQVNTASFNASRTIAALYTDANNELKIGKTNTGAFFASYKVGGTETVNVVNATAARVGNFKLAAAYNSTGMQLFINGVNGGSNTAGAVTGFNTVSVGHGQAAVEQFAEPISAFVLFKRRLGTNELTSLTD